MPGVTVTATNLGTNIPRTTVTTETGDYSFTLLPVGTYEIKTELAGFKTQAAKVQLATGDRARVDVKLELGTVSETLTVSGEAPLLQTDTSRVSSRLTNEIVQNAPIQGRNIVNMLQLTPGASEGQANATISGNRPDDRRPSSAVSINGNPENDNLHLVDGLDNIERVKSGMGIKLSLEAIQEVLVATNLYSAENGRTLGGVVNIITKSGGNQFRGSGFYFFRNQRFDSRSFFAPSKPLNHLNNFGGSISGPLKTNRTFFFADYEMGRIRKDRPFVISVPTVKMRNGDFSEQPGRGLRSVHDPPDAFCRERRSEKPDGSDRSEADQRVPGSEQAGPRRQLFVQRPRVAAQSDDRLSSRSPAQRQRHHLREIFVQLDQRGDPEPVSGHHD